MRHFLHFSFFILFDRHLRQRIVFVLLEQLAHFGKGGLLVVALETLEHERVVLLDVADALALQL